MVLFSSVSFWQSLSIDWMGTIYSICSIVGLCISRWNINFHFLSEYSYHYLHFSFNLSSVVECSFHHHQHHCPSLKCVHVPERREERRLKECNALLLFRINFPKVANVLHVLCTYPLQILLINLHIQGETRCGTATERRYMW